MPRRRRSTYASTYRRRKKYSRSTKRSTVRAIVKPTRKIGRSRKRTLPRLTKTIARAVLNTTTRKKKDVMLPVAGSIETVGSLGGTRIVAQPMTAPNQYFSSHFIWCPTARLRNATSIDGRPPTVADESTRTSTDCFMVGLRERINLESKGAASWFWRRIVFTIYGIETLLDPNGNIRVPWAWDGTTGTLRLVGSLNSGTDTSNAIRDNFLGLMFTGVEGEDWLDPIEAQVDKRRIKLISDRVTTINSGNDFGAVRNMKRYYAFNRTLRYNEEQDGAQQSQNLLSAIDSSSMGDVYVYDIFQNNRQASDQDWLDFSPEATLLWHER